MKDALGNELKVGQMVIVNLERPLVSGRVAAIERGGIVTGIRGKGEAEVKPETLVIVSNHIIGADPRNPVAASVMAVLDPNPPNAEAIVQLEEASSKRTLEN